MLDAANKLLESFDALEDKWSAPFPMGVFGTLRGTCGNSHLMRGFHSHHKAFMPHFYAANLSIHYKANSSAVFEIFTYTPEVWDKNINSIDMLESFRPGIPKYKRGYWRTLTWLHVLPKDYDSVFFKEPWPGDPRDLQISPKDWNKYPRVPCWVYSSQQDNELSKESPDSPIIWSGELSPATSSAK